jgi:FkbM family methyltransferase
LTWTALGNLRKFIALTADLGAGDGARLFLREIGVWTKISFSYPGIDRKFKVRFDPVWRWIDRGVRERGLLRFAEENIGAGQTVIDIGAHLGESSLLFSQLVGPTGRVVAFEPDPVARTSLEKNISMNDLAITTEPASVSDREGEAVLMAERLGSGAATIVEARALASESKKVKVRSTTVDRYCEAEGVVPDWVKIDAEGAEPQILLGMRSTLGKHRTSVILEFHVEGLSDEDRSRAWSVITSGASKVRLIEREPDDGRAYLQELPIDTVPSGSFMILNLVY